MRVSETESFENAVVCFSSSAQTSDIEATMAAASRLSTSAGKVRGMGAAASHMAYVADGRVDAFFDMGAKLWDVAAGIVLVREAGGEVTTRSRGGVSLDIAVSNGKFHQDFLREIAW